MNSSLVLLAQEAKKASLSMAQATQEQKNRALQALIQNLKLKHTAILEANEQDRAHASIQGLSSALLERLSLVDRLEGIVADIEKIVLLQDPIGECFEHRQLPNGLKLSKSRTPIGVLGVIYESRPNVTLDIAALAIKSGNCVLLRGGTETVDTNRVLVKIIQQSLSQVGLPSSAVQGILSHDRSEILDMLKMDAWIDLIIPRGGISLQRYCKENSTIPVIMGGVGICHFFVDATADVEKSIQVIANAKTQRPTVCNALNTLLVHHSIAPVLIPKLIQELGQMGVSFRVDTRAWQWANPSYCSLAGPQDWNTEWLSLVMGIKVVDDLEEAIEHIQLYSTQHSDGILTEDQSQAHAFIQQIDSAVVYVNASTRFTDGGEFGFGAEVAVSTQKFHARGPIGLNELTSYKWIVEGNYQIRR
jgi:glutamate-5-semialdehyde dehydrogenase